MQNRRKRGDVTEIPAVRARQTEVPTKHEKNNSSSGTELIRKLLCIIGKAKLLTVNTVVPSPPNSLLRMPVSLPHIIMQASYLSIRKIYQNPSRSETRALKPEKAPDLAQGKQWVRVAGEVEEAGITPMVIRLT